MITRYGGDAFLRSASDIVSPLRPFSSMFNATLFGTMICLFVTFSEIILFHTSLFLLGKNIQFCRFGGMILGVNQAA